MVRLLLDKVFGELELSSRRSLGHRPRIELGPEFIFALFGDELAGIHCIIPISLEVGPGFIARFWSGKDDDGDANRGANDKSA